MAAPEPGPSLLLAGLTRGGVAGGCRTRRLRGSDLGRVDVVAPAAIAIVDGRIAAVGPPDDVAPLARRPRDGGLPRRGRDPGPRRLPHASRRSAATGRASSTCAPRAPTTSASTRRAAASARPSRRPAAWARTAWRRAVAGTWDGWRPTARRRRRASRDTASIARPSSRASGRGRPAPDRDGPDLPRSALGAARVRLGRRVPGLRHRRGAAGGRRGWPSTPTSSSSAARSRPSRPTGTCARRWATASSPGCTATSSPSRARSRSRSSSARGRSTTSRRPARPASRRSPEATSAAVLLPVAALYLRRSQPPARALVDQGAIVALATDFNPGSAFCDSLPVVMTLACTALGMAPARGARGVHGERRLGARAGGSRRPPRPGLRRRHRAPRRAGLAAHLATTWPAATSRPCIPRAWDADSGNLTQTCDTSAHRRDGPGSDPTPRLARTGPVSSWAVTRCRRLVISASRGVVGVPRMGRRTWRSCTTLRAVRG